MTVVYDVSKAQTRFISPALQSEKREPIGWSIIEENDLSPIEVSFYRGLP